MNMNRKPWLLIVSLLVSALVMAGCAAQPAMPTATDPLGSWNPGPSRDAIISFVEAVTDPSSPDFVPVADRIAVFDNDGTLWSEQPMYFQLLFALDKVREMAARRPEWANEQPFKAVLENDMQALMAQGEAGLVPVLMAAHAGMTTDEFSRSVADWLATARHPRFDQPYDQLIYQPMLELLEYLREHGFQTWIVSGGGIDFVRVFSEQAYGIPPQQVVGSSVVKRFEMREGGPVIVREPTISFIDDKEGKPVAIDHHIGKRPIAAFGNSDGDLQMLQWTAAGKGPSLQVFIRHTDAEREWAYDRDSHIGRLDAGIDEAFAYDWLVVDMQQDWSVIYPFQMQQ
jgi:phosphoserine phosphatase